MSFQIFLKENKTYTMNVSYDTEIIEIRDYILKVMGIPSENYYLSIGNRLLDDNKKISDYPINSETTIHIIIRAVPNPVKLKIK